MSEILYKKAISPVILYLTITKQKAGKLHSMNYRQRYKHPTSINFAMEGVVVVVVCQNELFIMGCLQMTYM